MYVHNGLLLDLKEGNATTWMDFKEIMLSETSPSQKYKHCTILLTEETQ